MMLVDSDTMADVNRLALRQTPDDGVVTSQKATAMPPIQYLGRNPYTPFGTQPVTEATTKFGFPFPDNANRSWVSSDRSVEIVRETAEFDAMVRAGLVTEFPMTEGANVILIDFSGGKLKTRDMVAGKQISLSTIIPSGENPEDRTVTPLRRPNQQ